MTPWGNKVGTYPDRVHGGPCDECGRRLIGTVVQTPIGEQFCDRHRNLDACVFCLAPVADSAPNAARTPVTAATTTAEATRLCRRCIPGAVLDQDAVKAALPHVRGGLHKMGVRLRTPVRVRLVTGDDITAMFGKGHGGAVPLGATVSTGTIVVDLVVHRGLPPAQFGAVVAHEAMHAWLIQHNAPPMPLPLLEGVCELTAFGWLGRDRALRGAQMLREQIKTNPDRVYGDGFRQVYTSAGNHGVREVLASVVAAGRLPSGGPPTQRRRSTHGGP